MVTAAGVQEIAGLLAPQTMPQSHDALRKAVEYIERYGLMPAEKRRAARAELDALATLPRMDEGWAQVERERDDLLSTLIYVSTALPVLRTMLSAIHADKAEERADTMIRLVQEALDRTDTAALATEVPAAPQPAEWRDKIAAIVARAYGGSLYPGLGVPGDYPVEEVDYRAADAIGDYLAIVRQAVPPHSIAAIAAAWQRVVNALNDVPGGMHAELEDAASSFDELTESLLAGAPSDASTSTGYRCLDSRSLNGDAR
ncbi:hypothetical protein [Sphingomonas sp.]|uniref:hypothetical protein n=1 Tax=Sphingomonas sp. TaxID=28214 RepID=UPI003BAA1636